MGINFRALVLIGENIIFICCFLFVSCVLIIKYVVKVFDEHKINLCEWKLYISDFNKETLVERFNEIHVCPSMKYATSISTTRIVQ